MIYTNNTTGIKISYEFQEAYLYIMLYQLVSSKFIENPVIIKKNTTLYGYGLDDIIAIRKPSALMKPVYSYGDGSEYYNENKGMALFVSAFANNLKALADDVLGGDFKIFPLVDKLVKERAAKHT